MKPADFLKDVAFVIYPVSDLTTARRFYEEALGLKVTASWEDQWIEYDIGRGTLVITRADAGHQAGTHGPSLALEVAGFDDLLTALREAGVACKTDPWDTPVCRGCIICDPDGNEIMLHARK